jgi:hypothetical protein
MESIVVIGKIIVLGMQQHKLVMLNNVVIKQNFSAHMYLLPSKEVNNNYVNGMVMLV